LNDSLGTGSTGEESGAQYATKKSGSALCRASLWQWIFSRIEIARHRPKNELGKQIAEIFDPEKSHKPIKLAHSRTDAKAAQLLFKKLVEEITR
jgi:hypothetical protein